MQRTKTGTNIGGAGEHNRRVVMHGLRVNGAMTRAAIARGTGLVPQTVSNIVDDLEREGLVMAADPVKGGRGQPATPYSLAPNGAFSYGLQLDQHRARTVAIDLVGRIVAAREVTLGPGGLEANLERVLGALGQVAGDLARHAAQPRPRVLGLGLAMPAPTGVHAGRNDPWMTGLSPEHPLVQRLAQDTGLAVSLHHDASAAAVAERLSGSAKGIDNFVLIFLGYGLGAGIYANGEPCRGQHRLAGEIGQIMVPGPDGGRPLEQDAALIVLIAALGLQPNQPDLFDRMEAAIADGHPEVGAWLDRAARLLAWAIDLVECLLDPELVILGGQMPAELARLLMARLTRLRPALPDRPALVEGSVNPYSVAAGAAADPIARAFDLSFSAMMKPRA
ncbi:MAG: ROK family transcriptional regulator [Proteobacteria bacterium]|nr:ROK family transcriptional regulator [Pseudomonadota bacterium]MBS0572122.1 ROK family transcriptional regulator [Pseudomonadota bacterium]